MEKQKMNHLEKPEGWSHETSGEGYPLLLYLEEDGKGVDWNQEKYPCFFLAGNGEPGYGAYGHCRTDEGACEDLSH